MCGRRTGSFERLERVMDAFANVGVNLSCDFIFINNPLNNIFDPLSVDSIEAKFPRTVII